jgi:hypothetical protein
MFGLQVGAELVERAAQSRSDGAERQLEESGDLGCRVVEPVVEHDDQAPFGLEPCDRANDPVVALGPGLGPDVHGLTRVEPPLASELVDREVGRDSGEPGANGRESSKRSSEDIARTNASCAMSFASSRRMVSA